MDSSCYGLCYIFRTVKCWQIAIRMKQLNEAATHQLSAALGWMELGNPREALHELEQIPPDYRDLPSVLELRWMLYSCEADWDNALTTARDLMRAAPEAPESWLHHAYSLRRAGGGSLEAAWAALEPAMQKFPKDPTIPYNLACYACQLGRVNVAQDLLRRCFQTGRKKHLKEMALSDLDLKPLWAEIEEW